MILIADSGSTKTDWCVVDQGQMVRQVFTKGMNPVFQTREEMESELRHSLVPQLNNICFEDLHFFGAGCLPEKIPAMREMLSAVLKVSGEVEVDTDMIGAAKGLAGHNSGIICILGTGSNSCFYDGRNIVQSVPALGFILGDEGSGAVLGRKLVGDVLKNQLGSELKTQFLEQFNLTQADIIEKVYRQSFPNRFLASLAPFLKANLHHPEVYSLVKSSFKEFLKRNVMQYDYTHQKAYFAGSVAHHFEEVLIQAAKEEGISIAAIAQSPMDGLKKYYSDEYGIYKNHRATIVV